MHASSTASAEIEGHVYHDHCTTPGPSLGGASRTPNNLPQTRPWRRGLVVGRRSSAALLLFSTVSGMLAFALALLAGNPVTFTGQSFENECFPHRRCSSNRTFHYETVSEMVSAPSSPPQKIFQCLAVIASILLLSSRYPYEFRNVWEGSSQSASLRTILPAMGMMLVALVQVVPKPMRTTPAIKIACGVHTFGAVLFVGGYSALEARTLYRLRHSLRNKWEKRLRWCAVLCCFCCCLIFEAVGGILSFADQLGICCADEYESTDIAAKTYFTNETVTSAEQELFKATYGDKVLVNTAYAEYLTLKKLEFWGEAAAGMFVLLSHFFVWYFTEARKISLSDAPMEDLSYDPDTSLL